MLGGNQVVAPITAPINICGNSVAVVGEAFSGCEGGAEVVGSGPGRPGRPADLGTLVVRGSRVVPGTLVVRGTRVVPGTLVVRGTRVVPGTLVVRGSRVGAPGPPRWPGEHGGPASPVR